MSTLAPPESRPYLAPAVSAGAVVNYYALQQGPTAPPQPAIVYEGGDSAITVMILANRHLKDSVRHKSDPGLEDNAAWRQNGAWDYSDEYKQMATERKLQAERAHAIQATLAQLKTTNDDLVGALAHLTKRVDDLEKRRSGK